ncbi:MAG: D-sedoheptulose-7-phosphate isomerase [Planctomycetota bacterium]|jgi:D-sedoheptulose 7-phosphate isomerase
MIEQMVEKIKLKRLNRNTVFVCGNGGSASTAEHFANDLFSKGVKAICLNSNVAIITMIANDFGYDYIFEKQLEVYAEPNDLLIVFSCSGKSPNIAHAIQSGIEVITIFGDKWTTYAENENKHLAVSHRISELL